MIVIVMRMAIAIVVFMLLHRIFFWFMAKMEAEDAKRKAEMEREENAPDEPMKRLEKCSKCDVYVVEDEPHKCADKDCPGKE